MRFLVRYLIPGLALIGLGFFAGSIANPVLSLFGFLCFFVVGVTVIAEGWKNRKSEPPL